MFSGLRRFFIPGIFDLVRVANHAGMLVIVVTNQSGIGRGLYTEDQFHTLMAWMRGQFTAHDARLDAVYFSPFHPEHGIGAYRRESECRKPGPGMLLRAAREWSIHPGSSVILGDKPSDMGAGVAVGVGYRWLLSNEDGRRSANDYELVRSLEDARDRLNLLAISRKVPDR